MCGKERHRWLFKGQPGIRKTDGMDAGVTSNLGGRWDPPA